MIKKTLFFGNPCYLKMKNTQLVVSFPDSEKPLRSVPIEDIGIVILENQQITLTHGLIATLMDNNSAIISCNFQHLPHGLMLPMAQHSAFTEKMFAQLESSKALRKNLWQQTIQSKIKNQAANLNKVGVNTKNMLYWASQVKSGDPDNYEGRAAAYYWKNLFVQIPHFRRHRYGDAPNHLLNYAYSILRAIVARSLVGSGLFTALGIHHKNKYNAYCLADDIMEPYRPFVDALVYEIVDNGEDIEDMTTSLKAQLLGIATVDINIDDNFAPLMVGVQHTTASLRKCFEGTCRKITYPII